MTSLLEDIPEVYNTWIWKEQYPGATELREYFRHVDNTLDLSRDIRYNTKVTAATWNDTTRKWLIECEDGTHITARFFHCCLGFSAKRHFPDWPGLDSFAGRVCHSSFWPADGIEIRDKKVGVIGNGATGVQIAQEAASEAAELKVFIRTPNMCLPMGQGPVSPEETRKDSKLIGSLLGKERYLNPGGFLYEGTGRNTFDLDLEEREKIMEEHYRQGGFRLMFTFEDTLNNEEANRVMYDFWARKTRARIRDPVKREIMAPLEPPHAWAAKRLSMEQNCMFIAASSVQNCTKNSKPRLRANGQIPRENHRPKNHLCLTRHHSWNRNNRRQSTRDRRARHSNRLPSYYRRLL